MNAIMTSSEQKQKYCKVCGDTAIGFNFGVVSCESCKSFFRRYRDRDLERMRCPFDNNCQIGVANRTACKRCRMILCLQAGMHHTGSRRRIKCEKTKEYSISDDDFQRQRVSSGVSDSSGNCSLSTGVACQTELTPQFYNEIVDQQELKSLQVPVVLPDRHKFLLEEIKAATIAMIPDFNDIKNFFHSGMVLNSMPVDYLTPDSFAQIVNRQYKRLIEFCKLIGYFNQVNDEDQVTLVKAGLSKMHFLRQCFAYKPDEGKISTGRPPFMFSISIDTVRRHFPIGVHRLLSFMETFNPDWLSDKTIFIIMAIIELFNPKRTGLIDINQITSYQNEYKELLLFYLESIYGSNAKCQYEYHCILRKLDDLQNVDTRPDVIKRAHPDSIGPLLSEIFDLNLTQPQITPTLTTVDNS